MAKSFAAAAAVVGAPMVAELNERRWFEEAVGEWITMDRSSWKWVVVVVVVAVAFAVAFVVVVVAVVVVGSSTDSAISESIVLLVRR